MDRQGRNGDGVVAAHGKVRQEITHSGQVARIILAAPKGNVLDRALMLELMNVLAGLALADGLKAIVITGDGPHFSFGASVEEHLPAQIRETLAQLRNLLEALAAAPAPTIAAVRGQCLGGGFELALACDLIAAEEGSQFALPEIKLGVFPPAGAALLPVKVGAGRSAELILTGKSWNATSAQSAGLVHKLASPGELDLCIDAWLQTDFLPRSATALRYAARAARRPLLQALRTDLPEFEQMYLTELMQHEDACEGIHAFLEKRQPHWPAPQ